MFVLVIVMRRFPFHRGVGFQRAGSLYLKAKNSNHSLRCFSLIVIIVLFFGVSFSFNYP